MVVKEEKSFIRQNISFVGVEGHNKTAMRTNRVFLERRGDAIELTYDEFLDGAALV